MKKEAAIFVLSVILFSGLASALVNFDMKQEYNQGETFIIKISGAFTEPVSLSQISLYKGHVRIPANFYIAKINEDYYIYTQTLGKSPGEYSLKIKNLGYSTGIQNINEDVYRNFSITNKTSDFLVDPGFITTTDDFSLKFQNLKSASTEININPKTIQESTGSLGDIFGFLFGGSSNSTVIFGADEKIYLKPGETKEVKFSVNDFENSELRLLEFSSENTKYSVPVLIIVDSTQKIKKFRFDPSELEITTSTDSCYNKIIYLSNIGQEEISNVEISISDSLKLYTNISIKEISSLKKNSSSKIELVFCSDSEKKNIEGQITAKEEDGKFAYCSVSLNFLQGYKPPQNQAIYQNTSGSLNKGCSELNGTVCKNSEKCDGNTQYSRDGNCCLSKKCTAKGTSSTQKIIGWIAIVIVIIFLLWFFKFKYKGARKEVSLIDVARGRR